MNLLEKIGIGLLVLFVIGAVFLRLPSMPIQAIAPKEGAIIKSNSVTFLFSGKPDVLYVDSNPEFTSPQVVSVKNKNAINLVFEAGTYYWKLEKKSNSTIQSFTIASYAGIEVEVNDLGTTIKNKGTVDLEVIAKSPQKAFGLTGALIVPAGKNRVLPNVFVDSVEAKEHEQ